MSHPSQLFTRSDFSSTNLSDPLLKLVVASDPEDIYDPSAMQISMLLNAIEHRHYIQHYRWDFESAAFDSKLYQKAWQIVAGKLKALRTSFFWKESQVLAIVNRSVQMAWKEWDWTSKSKDKIEELVSHYLKTEMTHFDVLSTNVALHLCLIRMSQTKYVL